MLFTRSVFFVALASTAAAQAVHRPLGDLYVTDSSNDTIAYFADLNYDGDYDDPGEVVIFYDETLGPYTLSNNVGLAATKDGVVYVCDSSTDQVLRMQDLNGDGDANDLIPGTPSVNETTLFFESFINGSSIEMASAAGMHLEGDVLWIAVGGTGTTGKDFILRLEDLDQNGDAMAGGEAKEYCVLTDPAMGGNGSDSLPQDVTVGLDGNVYYVEIGTTGVHPKGIYKLVDFNGDGSVDPNDPAEYFQFFIPVSPGATPFYWCCVQAPDGAWYMADTGNELVWRAYDANGDGLIDPNTEAVQWWNSPLASNIWNVRWGADGRLYAGDTQSNDRMLVLEDKNGSGFVENGIPAPNDEVVTAYDQLLALGASIGQIRGFILEPQWQMPWETYCTAQVGQFCTGTIGWSGWPSVSVGSGFFLEASNIRNQKYGILFYGTTGRQSVPFNGGTMCVSPPQRRTPIQSSGGSPFGVDDCTGNFSLDFNARIALGLDPALIAGVVVDAQYWSRDPGAMPVNTNLTNALEFLLLR